MLERAAKLPDLNPIEHIQAYIKNELHDFMLKTFKILEIKL